MKLGGGLLAHGDELDAALATIGAGRARRLLVVPGGGPFADAVRDIDRRLRLSDDAAHWMAVLAMDQCAHLIADRLADGVLVADTRAVVTALDAGKLPVLAPFQWMREADPLPHSWDVTSDSIAAWIAGEVGARRLVLVKPSGALQRAADDVDLVDKYFARSVPAGIEVVAVAADQRDALRRAMQLFD